MDQATAKQIATQVRPAHDVPVGYALHGAERRIIEISEGAAGMAQLVRDVRVWIVRFQGGIAWAELAVDEATGTVVRVQEVTLDMKGEFERFAWEQIERKLAASGVASAQGALGRFVSIVRQALPDEKAREGVTPGPVVSAETQTLTRFALYFRRADMTVELNANTGEPMSWMCSKFADGNAPLTPPEAMRVAEAAANLPPNAVLFQQGYEDMGGRPVFVAHWEHREDGVLVERDYVRVLVSGHSGRVFAIQRRWHDVDLNPSER